MLTLLQTSWLLLILLLAAWQDIKTRTISNSLILIGFAGLIFFQIYQNSLQFMSFVIGVLVGLFLWKYKFIGGGDSKLVMLISTAFEPAQLLSLYAFIAISGALQALYYLNYKPQKTLPYAVAILIGTSVFILLQKKTSWFEAFL